MSGESNSFILIVDDNPTNLSVLSQALKRSNYKVRVAVTGEDAIAQVERIPPVLILLDIQMPGISGFETCRRLKANPETQNIPIIFMTALADASSKMQGLSLGAVDYITKPFEQEEVLARVKIHWELKQLRDALEQRVIEQTAALQQKQTMLVQQEKLSALGEIVAGVAHELNNPISFIVSNIKPAQEYLSDIKDLLVLYQQEYSQPTSIIQQKIAEMDLEFVLSDFSKLLNSMELGTERIKDISSLLRNYTRSDADIQVRIDIHEALETNLLLLKHRLIDQGDRPAIKVVKNYSNIPCVPCYPGPIQQVFMNILANAIDALEEFWEQEKRSLEIKITTEVSYKHNYVTIRIADNGLGMSESVREHLFEPLFTTKGVDKGTGLGLSISQEIIEEKHGGNLFCISSIGQGTEFVIEIPL